MKIYIFLLLLAACHSIPKMRDIRFENESGKVVVIIPNECPNNIYSGNGLAIWGHSDTINHEWRYTISTGRAHPSGYLTDDTGRTVIDTGDTIILK